MHDKLLYMLGDQNSVRNWRRTPIAEWSGFTVEDMEGLGFHMNVQKWFHQLTDDRIIYISQQKSLSIH